MHRYTSLVHVEQLEMAKQSVKDQVQFKLYSTEQTTINYTYSNTTHDSHQATMKPVTSSEIEDSDVSWLTSGFGSMIIERQQRAWSIRLAMEDLVMKIDGDEMSDVVNTS